jgi:demethylmenaquinone methyltransferase/2-methoxy-6-polyprenyl-1,4-benzoquinol methylase
VLDVCTGTGDLAVALQRRGAATVGVDFCPEMVRLAAAKTGATAASAFVVGDALRLPFAAGTFEAATVAFGIRNVADPLGGVREMARVCRPGGRVVVLEFCRPRVPGFAPLYGFYFKTVLPRIGAAVSGDREGAYRYLQQTVAGFPERDEFLDIMRAAGLVQLRYEVVSLGIACIYHGSTPARVARRPPAASGRVEAEVS